MPPRPRVPCGVFHGPDAFRERFLARALWPNVDLRPDDDVGLRRGQIVFERAVSTGGAVSDVGNVFGIAGDDLRGFMVVAVEGVAIPDINVDRVMVADNAPRGSKKRQVLAPQPALDLTGDVAGALADARAF